MKKTLLLRSLFVAGVLTSVAYAERSINIITDGGESVFSETSVGSYTMLGDYTKEALENNNDNLSATIETLDMAGHDFTLNVDKPSTTVVNIGNLVGSTDSDFSQSRPHSGTFVWNALWVGSASEFAGTITVTGNSSTKKLMFGVGSTTATNQADFSKASAVTLTNAVFQTASSDAVFKKLTLNNVKVNYTDGTIITNNERHSGAENKQATLTLGAGSSLTNTTLSSYINLKVTGNTTIQSSTVNHVNVTNGTLTLNSSITYAAGSVVSAAAGTMLDIGGSSTQTMSAVNLGENSEMLVRMSCTVGSDDSLVDINMAQNSKITLYGGSVKGHITVNQAATIRGSRNNDSASVSGTITGNGTLTLGADSNGYKNAWSVYASIADGDAQSPLSLVLNSKSAVTLSGENTYSGGTTISQGTLIMQNSQALGSGSVSVAAGANLAFSSELSEATVGALTLGSGAAITLNNDHAATLTTSGLTVEGNATFNGNLVVNSGMLSFADQAILTMGRDVTLSDDVTVVLTDEMVATIAAGGRVDLFDSVEHAYLGQNVSFAASSGSLENPYAYMLNYDGSKIYVTPEPATATLSLLALAGLAARRRRK